MYAYFAGIQIGTQIAQRMIPGINKEVFKKGNGQIPGEEDVVKVHYEGRFIDGDVFDSTYERGEPASFRVSQVIKGWAEALTNMPVGSIWEVYIPHELAYAEREQGVIKPFSVLIFKIELLSIEKEE